jgi:4-aminobutyrate aminotransferase/(S)-3-amino-2-methylpropionate transaminase
VKSTGAWLHAALVELAKLHPDVFAEPRGLGTFAAIDARDTPTQRALLTALRERGVEAGGSGAKGIRFRPTLTFSPRHAAEAIATFDDAALGLRSQPIGDAAKAIR